MTDGPAVLGLARFVELDERYALEPAVQMLEAATASGLLRVQDPQTLVRLLFGAMTRAGLLIASSTRPEGDQGRRWSHVPPDDERVPGRA